MTGAGQPARIDVLGPLRVTTAGGADITPPGVLQRRALGLLVMRRGQVTTIDSLVDALWPGELPSAPAAAVQNHVSRLRRALPPGAIESVGDGYRLRPEAVDLDADRLAVALSRGAAAGADLQALLARWRGPAYPELDDLGEARAEAARLDDLRIRAIEAIAEGRLASGDTDGLVASLSQLVDEHPLRERPVALLVDALVAAGRRVDALRAYDDLRRRLGDELGIEPSPQLQARHADLLGGRDDGGWRPATRLPSAAASLVGRDGLLVQVDALCAAARLVTLVGPGGVGKTRLLTEVGHRLRTVRTDVPVVWCELATADESSAVDAVAGALGIDGRPGVPLEDRVAATIGDLDLVLLLDNCEHVLEPIARLTDLLLRRCGGVRVVASSRERLRVAGEHVRVVAPLSTVGEERSVAAQLFLERARAVAAEVGSHPTDGARIAEIVRRLDGLPLAIELAAARLHTLALDEIAAALDQRLALLSSGYRTSSRHGSLGAAIAWSYELLDTPLRLAFTDVSVFAGDFTQADAVAVTGLAPEAAVDALDRLTERSLVVRPGSGRWALLETLRAFGQEQLGASGRLAAVGRRHARHQLVRAEQWSAELHTAAGASLDRVDGAVPELRAALRWALGHGEVELAGRVVVSLFEYAFLRLRPDVYAWSTRVTAADPEDTSPVAAEVWVASGYAAWMAGDLAEMGRCCVRAERAAGGGGDEPSGSAVPAAVFELRATLELVEGRVAAAASWYCRAAARAAVAGEHGQRLMAAASELLALGYAGDPAVDARAAALLTEIGDLATPHAAFAWYCAGEADLALGTDLDRARQRLRRGREIADVTHAALPSGLAGASLASIEARWGDADGAAVEYRRVLMQWRRAGMWSTQWTMLRSVAVLLARLGRDREAAVLVGAVRSTAAGHRIFGADAVELDDLTALLRHRLGEIAFEVARREGARLDGAATVEHALRSL